MTDEDFEMLELDMYIREIKRRRTGDPDCTMAAFVDSFSEEDRLKIYEASSGPNKVALREVLRIHVH